MDYQKIKHICDERIRQIEFEVKAEDIIKDKVDNLYTLIGNEISRLTTFLSQHQLCGGVIETSVNNIGGISTVSVKCPICGQSAEIASYEV